MSHQIENISTEVEIIRKNQMEILELKRTTTEIKNWLECSTVDLNWQKNELANIKRDYVIQRIQRKENEEKQSLREMWDTVKFNNLHKIKYLERVKKEDKIFEEIMAACVANLMKTYMSEKFIEIQVEWTERDQNRDNSW